MTGQPRASRRWPRLALLALLAIAIGVALTYRDQLNAEALEEGVAALGIWAPVAFIATYLIAPVLFLPGAPLTLTAGALFGPLWGTVYTLIGSVGGASLSFLISRYIAGDWAEARAGGMILRLKQGVEQEGWRFVAFVRLVPLFPFNLLNYALGLTRIPFLTYALTSAIAMLPGIFGYVYIGYAGREALTGGENLIQKGLLALAILAVLVFLPLFIRRMRGGRTAQGVHPPPPGPE